MLKSYAELGQRVDAEQITVMAGSSRFWHPGDAVWPGQRLGDTLHGMPVHATISGRVAKIQYDLETDEVILIVEAVAHGG